MREIKFRVWDNKKKQWANDDLWDLGYEFGLCYCDMEGFAIQDDGGLLLVDECGRHEYIDTERFEVSWSTGLHDNNGREIFEGDIVKTFWQHDGASNWDYERVGTVIWHEHYLQFMLDCEDDLRPLCSFDREDIFEEYTKIIGNIHENPELLDVKK